ncbi:MAG TPA: hypothetical protein PKY81_11735 [bacterium]|nr:hypothetical protein [bacterium]HPN31618.1 hypothetical protein [bacterium]
MVVFLNAAILFFLSLIGFKAFGWFGVPAAFIFFAFIFIIIQLLTVSIKYGEFERLDLSGINLLDVLLYKIFGEVFIKFRKQKEIEFENFYYNLCHFFEVKFKLYALLIFLVVILTSGYFYLESKKIQKKINSVISTQVLDSASSQKKFEPPDNIKSKQLNANIENTVFQNREMFYSQDSGALNRDSIISSEIKSDSFIYSDEAYFLRLSNIQEFKSRYGDKWDIYLIKALNYYKENKIENTITASFIKKDGSYKLEP